MIEIIKPNINTGYEIIEIPNKSIVIEYLKSTESRFSIMNIDCQTKERILSLQKLKEFPGGSDDYIACYFPVRGNSFRSSGGLKLSSKNVRGSFVIEEERIIYDSTERFYEERDFGKCNCGPLNTFYTTSSMMELLSDELELKRDYFLYVGNKVTKKPPSWTEELQPVSKEELLSYADDFEKGEKLYQKIITRKYDSGV